MEWIWNGLVITTVKPQLSEHLDPYRGVSYGQPWPLQHLEFQPGSTEYELVGYIQAATLYKTIKRLDGLPSAPVTNDDVFYPAVIPDINIVYQYIDCCKKQGIPIRVLLCTTTAQYPIMEEAVVKNLLVRSKFLGYDYISHDCGFSALYQDIISLPHTNPAEFSDWLKDIGLSDHLARLEKHSSRLNDLGLFNTSSDLEAYIAERWDIARQTSRQLDEHTYESLLEGSVELWPCGVHELQLPSAP